jgi:hypothetical protein
MVVLDDAVYWKSGRIVSVFFDGLLTFELSHFVVEVGVDSKREGETRIRFTEVGIRLRFSPFEFWYRKLFALSTRLTNL